MSTIIQLNPPVHGYCPLGECFARFLIDYGPDLNPVFVVDLFEKNRQALCVDSNEFHFGENAMYDLQKPKPIKERNI